jgi:hypothetical protein
MAAPVASAALAPAGSGPAALAAMGREQSERAARDAMAR